MCLLCDDSLTSERPDEVCGLGQEDAFDLCLCGGHGAQVPYHGMGGGNASAAEDEADAGGVPFAKGGRPELSDKTPDGSAFGARAGC